MRKTLFLLAWPLVAAFLPLLSHGACPRDALRLSELCFWPQAGQPQWVEIANTSTEETFNCAGVEIVSNGASYSLPNELADVPPGAKIVIYFDGETAQNDYAFDGDNKAELHPPAPGRVSALGNPVGYCSLFRVTSAHGVDTLLDFVAWGGEPGDAAKDAVEKRLWSTTGVYLAPPASEMRDGPGAKMIVQGGTLGRVNEAWKILSPAQATPGTAFVTVLTAPILEFPSDGLQGDAPTRLWFKGVEGAAGYQVQVSDIVVFSNLLVDGETAQAAFFLTGVTLAGDTTYYWRVRSLNGTGDSSPWSIVYSFTVGTNDVRREQGSAKTSVPATRDGKTVTGKVVDKATNNGLPGVEVQLGTEKKNSDASGNFSFPGVAPGTYPITMTLKGYTFPAGLTVVVAAADVVVPNTQGEGKTKNLGIDPKGGARKDTKMLAIKPGASSKIMCDKTSVSKQNWCTANPRPTHHPKDLESWWCWAVGIGMVNWHYGGTLTRDEIVYKVRAEILHDEDAGSHWGNYITGLYWAFGQAGAAKFDIRNRGGANVTEDEMVTWLDANRPIYFRRPGHIMVIDGYRYRDGKFECKFLNTDNNGAQKWWVFSTVANGGVACPKTELAASARKTDVKIAADGDGDGVCDFDEDHRFASSKTSADSDGDGLNDKIEITSWVFPRESTGRLNTTGKKFNVPDVDGDGLYPEVDP
ncbi:MAG: carboxypeptidase regulatory-like domain-containing protein, partial [Lentisphaeria bacterium]|nr:carboxypeptidase regulatory-like domain-containing protein [Lentisphaeria bacterium]